LQGLAAVPWSQTKGAQAGVEGALGPQQAQDGAIFVADKARRLVQGAIDVPHFLGTFRVAPLVYRDAETARIDGPQQQVEKLLAAGCRAAVLLADRHRHPAQFFGPGKYAGVGLVRRVGIVSGHIQHRYLARSEHHFGAASEIDAAQRSETPQECEPATEQSLAARLAGARNGRLRTDTSRVS
jgi:hypothetical protein